MDRKETLKRKFDFTDDDESTDEVLHENSRRLTLADDITNRIDLLNSVFSSSDPDIGSAQNALVFLSEYAKDGMFVCNPISLSCFKFFVIIIDFERFLFDLL